MFDLLVDKDGVLTPPTIDVIPPFRPACYLIHVAAYDPDGSVHPLYNISSNLDDVSWTTVGEEMRKVNAHIHSVLARPNLTAISRGISIGVSSALTS
jgi:hypothetical protein